MGGAQVWGAAWMAGGAWVLLEGVWEVAGVGGQAVPRGWAACIERQCECTGMVCSLPP